MARAGAGRLQEAARGLHRGCKKARRRQRARGQPGSSSSSSMYVGQHKGRSVRERLNRETSTSGGHGLLFAVSQVVSEALQDFQLFSKARLERVLTSVNDELPLSQQRLARHEILGIGEALMQVLFGSYPGSGHLNINPCGSTRPRGLQGGARVVRW
jgi:hypothetical protein